MSNVDPKQHSKVLTEGPSRAGAYSPRQNSRSLLPSLAAGFVLGFASLLSAQTAAPLPAQLSTAKTIFLANAGSNAGPLANVYFDQAYNALYQALGSSNRFQIVTTPAGADLSCEFSMNAIVGPTMQGDSSATFFVQLAVRDPKTQALLWTISEAVEKAFRTKTAEKNVTDATAKLAEDLKELASRSPSVVTNSQSQEPPPQKTRFSQKEK